MAAFAAAALAVDAVIPSAATVFEGCVVAAVGLASAPAAIVDFVAAAGGRQLLG